MLIRAKELQPKNAWDSMQWTPSRRVTSVRLVQVANAQLLINLAEEGMVMHSKELQALNVSAPIVWSPSRSSTFLN